MKRTASAVWQGDLKGGRGSLSTGSGVLADSPYSFGTRFESGKGTNPEELIGAAHAGCFSMALSMMMGQEGGPPERIETTATVTLEKQGEGFAITAVHLDAAVKTDMDDETFQRLARQAKENCPVSQVLNAEITLEARLL